MQKQWLPDLDQTRGPLYWRIGSALANDIRSGRLTVGEQLPTHRALAQALGVTVNTVTKAFAEAERNGLVVSRVGRGTYVKGFPEEMILDGDKPEELIDLNSNIATTDALDPVLNRIMGALSRRGSLHGLLQYYPYPGIARHRTAGARWVQRRAIEARANNVIVCNGAQEGLMTALSAITRPGDTVLTEKLNYAGLRYVAKCLNIKLYGVEMDEQGVIPDALEAGCRREKVSAILLTPTNHNPTNTFTSLERRQAIVDIAGRTGTLLVEDDTFGHLTDDQTPTLTALAPSRCIYVCGLGKDVAAGLRVGYIAAPVALVNTLINSLRDMSSTYPALMGEIATALIDGGHADKFVAWHRKEARRRYGLTQQILELEGPTLTSYHAWLPCPDRLKAPDVTARLRDDGVLVSSSEKFAVDHQTPANGIRISLGSIRDQERLLTALQRIADCFNERPSKHHNVR